MTNGRSAAVLGACATVLALNACDRPGSRNADTPSGLPVPRYVSLSKGEAAARGGPSDDHPVVSVYRARGLPVQVVAETEDWKRICDPEGGAPVWVKNRLLDGHRTVMRVQPGPAPIHKRPNGRSEMAGWLAPRALASLDRCDKGWCRIKVGSVKGWTPQAGVWGTAPEPQCRG